MRILMLSDRIPPENAGGAEKVAWALARGLRDAGHELHVIAATREPSFEAVREGIPTYHLHVQYPSRLAAYFALYNPQVVAPLHQLYHTIKPDVVSAFNIHTDLTYYSLSLAHQLHIPTTITLQDVMAFSYTKLTHFIQPPYPDDITPEQYRLPRLYNLKKMRLRYNPLRNLLIQRILRQVNVRIAGSEALRQALTANGLSDFRVLHASVVPQDFDTDPATVENLRERLNLAGRKVILFAGRLSHDKGSVQLLATLDRLVKVIPNVTLLTLTRATLEQQGLTAPEYQHLLDHVCVGGWMQGEELAAAYQLADVVVVPSICLDVFPTINLEAMAAGKPIIATCYGGSPEAISDGETGYIVNPFNTERFADRLQQLLTDERLARQMGEAGRQRLLTQFTLTRQVALMEQAYQAAIKQL
ncbi:MAG: glycosyltransferase family 4 protein [Anaerolineae bacterium]|nr:glycosyltransferase family 4 protein [Anaerolineae bacterium]